jgi:hypothetical protein
MMALMPRKAIYLFDICFLALSFDRAAFALRSVNSGGGTPKIHRLLGRNTPAQFRSENPRRI